MGIPSASVVSHLLAVVKEHKLLITWGSIVLRIQDITLESLTSHTSKVIAFLSNALETQFGFFFSSSETGT